MQRIIVIGGGAAGMFAAYSSASNGKSVTLIEKNEKLGKKIYITGKGRCNLTNDLLVEDFFKFVVTNPKFTYSCINAFSPHDTMSFFENNGLSLKTERGNRVFPLSDKASDVTKTLEKVLKKGVRYMESPISYDARSTSEGKKIGWKDGVQAIWTLIKYRFFA